MNLLLLGSCLFRFKYFPASTALCTLKAVAREHRTMHTQHIFAWSMTGAKESATQLDIFFELHVTRRVYKNNT